MSVSADRWARIEALFHQASAIPVDHRAAWLDVHCDGDPDLKREVASLLAADVSGPRVTSAIGDALQDTARAAASTSLAGERVGPYRIVRELGQGGMGTVYLAEREGADFEQRVAIKLLRGLLAAESVDRFRAERRILAPLQHPNIARLIDGGTTDAGVPYLVMEYVEGVPIDRYCDERNLGIPDRLKLFCQVCDAVDLAHRSLVVHRDIKPSNILVTAEGTPKLLDFGIAKLLDVSGAASPSAPVTLSSARMLTPEYASPEQVRGEPITTAADTYSLGVLLYELVTGSRPYTFATQSLQEIERVVCGLEPPKPSASARTKKTRPSRVLVGDLDTIILTALRKEPARRYPSAAHLADDLRRYLDGRPILARPATWRYRTSRFVTRHRWGVAAAAVIVALLVGSAVVFVAQAARVQQERDTAEQVITFLTGLFAVADPSESRGNTITAREILDRGVERISVDLKEQPAVQARLLDAMGRVYRELGLFDRSSDTLDQALKLRLAQDGPDDLTTAATMAGLADALRERGRVDEAEPLVRKALEIRQRLAGPRDAATARSLNSLGLIAQQRGNWDEAARLFEESIAILRERLGPSDPQVAVGLANVGTMYRDRGDFDRAETAIREALAIREKVFGEMHPSTATSVTQLGQLLDQRGDDVEAEALLRRALAVRERVFGGDHPLIPQSKNNLASVLHDQGKYAEAEPLYRAAIDDARKRLGVHGQVAVNINNLATLMEDAGRYPEAEQYYRESLAMRRQLFGGDHPIVGRSLNNLARFLTITGRSREALPVIDDALRIRRARLGEDHLEVTHSIRVRATVLGDLGRIAESEAGFREALARYAKQLPPGHLTIAETETFYARMLIAAGRAADAEPHARGAHDIRAAQLEPTHWQRAQADATLGAVLASTDRAAEGVPLMRSALDVLKKSLPAGDPRIAEVERWLARFAA